MTNYNERLVELLEYFGTSCARQSVVTLEDVNDAKQALTSLTKELVAELQPDFDNIDNYNRSFLEAMFKAFEQNLLKALE